MFESANLELLSLCFPLYNTSLKWDCQIKNIAMEILDFYDNYRQIPDERISAAVSKLMQRM